jgi:hypothetical protein
MRKLGVLGCILMGLLMPGRLAKAAAKTTKQRTEVAADARAAMESGLENEPASSYDYAPEPSGKFAPGSSGGRNYSGEPSCGCNYSGEPNCGCNYSGEPNCGCNCAPKAGCGCGMREFDPDALVGGMWDSMVGGVGNSCGGQPDGCCECCSHSSGVWAMGELMFFRYHRADGVRVGVDDGEGAEFDFEKTPRITVGWVREDGLGVRARYWEFDHNAAALGPDEVGSRLDVDTYTFDFELFDTFCLNRNWDLELSAGIRYCDFLEVMVDGDAAEVRLNAFNGFGGVASAELRRCIGTSGHIWVRARMAILMDDKDIFNDNGGGQQVRLLDATVGMTELAFGYDLVMPLSRSVYAFAGVQAEWQNWYNFSSGFEDTANTEDFAGPADVGFGGYGFRAGIAR